VAFTEVDPTAVLTPHPVPQQYGPLRQFDREMRCACRGCSSSTFYKVCGVPRCMTHALRELNLMLHGAWPNRKWRSGNSDES